MSSLTNIAFVLYRYGLEVSPTVKGVSEYFASKNISCNIFIDELQRERSFSLPHAIVHEVTPFFLSSSFEAKCLSFISMVPYVRSRLSPWLRTFFLSCRNKQFGSFLSTSLQQYRYILCFEFHSLAMIARSGIPLENVLYFSLELEQLMIQYPKEYCSELLSRCRGCIIQDNLRADDLNKYLGRSLKFGYLPVSRSPVPFFPQSTSHDVSIVFSGYFASWSCLEEIVSAFKGMERHDGCSLTLQGHAVGTEGYLDAIQRMVVKDETISMMTEFLSDNDHLDFLRRHHIGLALYRADSDLSNWNNLLFSSGKIANYAWTGLAIMTNIDSPLTKEPPFIYVDEISPKSFEQSIKKYEIDREQYHESAKKFALDHYNLFSHMQKIEKTFLPDKEE